ncbi:MAG: HAMP domain-containing protein [Candidatus Rokubacteria bacterium]|nr:HAMP domain-containing protein [Candidatus Rokubacteria bacterium]
MDGLRNFWSSLSLRAKFAGATLLVLALMMAALIGMVERRQRETIIEEVRKRGVILAKDLAAVSTNALLLYNYTALEQNVERFGVEADVFYAVVLDMEEKIAAFSRQPGRVGSTLSEPVDLQAAAATELLVQETMKDGQAIYDVAVPIFVEGTPRKWGTVRIGLSKRRMEMEIVRTRWELMGLAAAVLVCGGVAAVLVAQRIARPVRELVNGVEAVTRGDLEQRIAIRSRDELGTLAGAFNQMAAELGQQRTALERAHGELREKFHEISELKRYADNILASMTDGLVTLDLEGRVVTWNAMAEHLTRLAAEEIRGQPAGDVFRESKEFCELLLDTMTQRRAFAHVAVSFHRPDGQGLPMEMSTSPLKGAEGQDLGVVGIFRDMTAQRELEAQLRRADRLAALGTLAAGVAHEIRNPLVFVRTFTQMFPAKHADEEFRSKFAEMIPGELDRINEIVEGLLELSRPASLNFAMIPLHPLLERVVGVYAGQLESQRIVVQRRFDPSVESVWADGEHLYRVLVNLVLNAIQAMDRGEGCLTLTTRRLAPGDPLTQAKARSTPQPILEEYIAIDVGDTGPGIPEEITEKLFTPFFTTKQKKGTGLGLALALRTVEDHGGGITFRSQVGIGTVFTVVLPPGPRH